MSKELDRLLQKALTHYNSFKDSGYIVEGSYPILYFGDHKEYSESKIKIITVGLNPSDKEFPKKNKYQRFPKIRAKNSPDFLEAYNHYFKTGEAYSSWFDSYKTMLNWIKCSYYPNETFHNRALHTDICTTLATKKKWSALPKDFKRKLKSTGVKLWHDLVRILKPDIIICSFAEKWLNEIQFEFIEDWKRLYTIKKKADGKHREPYIVRKAKISIGDSPSYIFWGNQMNKPFGSVSNKDKEKVGMRILKMFER